MTRETEDRLRELATHLTKDLELRGRWFWTGWHGQSIHLATRGGGQMYVMGFERMGMSGAQPNFPHKATPEARWSLITKAMALPRFEVCPEATDPKDDRVYRKTLNGIKTPVAEYLAAVDADTILDLLNDLSVLRGEVAVLNEKLAQS